MKNLLIIIALAAAGAFGYQWNEQREVIAELEIEVDEMAQQVEKLQRDVKTRESQIAQLKAQIVRLTGNDKQKQTHQQTARHNSNNTNTNDRSSGTSRVGTNTQVQEMRTKNVRNSSRFKR